MTSLHTPSIAAFSLSPSARLYLQLQPCCLSPPTIRIRGNLPSFLAFPPRSGRHSPLIPTTTAAAAVTSKPSIHQDEDGNCVFGKKEYWDEIYGGDVDDARSTSLLPTTIAVIDRRPSIAYSWYCGWDELQPFWKMLVPNEKSRVVIAGIGNDPTPVGMYDAGWTTMMAYDYSQRGVDRAKELFGTTGTGSSRRDTVDLVMADASDLPLETASVDATLDKGTLGAIYITGKDIFRDSVKEMGRVTATGGCVVSISTVIGPADLLGEFDNPFWENVHDGSLAFAPDGEATIDLGAEFYSWKRTAVPYE